MTEELLPFCECGECGRRVTKKGNRFINGHQNRGRERSQKTKDKLSKALTGVPKPPRTPEHCDAMSKAHTDVPRPPETCAAISKALTGVPHSLEHIAAINKGCDKMRGGNDIVNHHYIYDHNDLSLNTVQMTRSDHQKLHKLLQKLAYIVPHINLSDEDSSETCDEVL